MFLLMSNSIDVFSSLIFCLLCNDQHLLSHSVLDRRSEHSTSCVSCQPFWVRLDADVRKHLSVLLLSESRLHFCASLFRLCCVMNHCLQKFQRSCHLNQTLRHALTQSKESSEYGQYVHKRCLSHLSPFLTTHRG